MLLLSIIGTVYLPSYTLAIVARKNRSHHREAKIQTMLTRKFKSSPNLELALTLNSCWHSAASVLAGQWCCYPSPLVHLLLANRSIGLDLFAIPTGQSHVIYVDVAPAGAVVVVCAVVVVVAVIVGVAVGVVVVVFVAVAAAIDAVAVVAVDVVGFCWFPEKQQQHTQRQGLNRNKEHE